MDANEAQHRGRKLFDFINSQKGSIGEINYSPAACATLMAISPTLDTFMANVKATNGSTWWVNLTEEDYDLFGSWFCGALDNPDVEVSPEMESLLGKPEQKPDVFTRALEKSRKLNDKAMELAKFAQLTTELTHLNLTYESWRFAIEGGDAGDFLRRAEAEFGMPIGNWAVQELNKWWTRNMYTAPAVANKPSTPAKPEIQYSAVATRGLPYDIELRPMLLTVPKVDVGIEPDVSMLNPEQRAAFDTVMAVLRGEVEEEHALLTGPAGTGKTFVTQKIIHRLLNKNPGLKIAMVAPTHKAVQVSRSMSPFANNQKEYDWDKKNKDNISRTTVSYLTVHSLLELVPTCNASTGWVEVFLPRKGIKEGEEKIRQFDIIFCDEVGMCDGGDKGLLTKMLGWKEVVTFVFIGDQAQLDPVNSSGIQSPIFIPRFRKDHGIAHAALETVMRQALDSPVLELATQVRGRLGYPRRSKASASGQLAFIPVDLSKNVLVRDRARVAGELAELDDLIWGLFGSRDFDDNSDFAKILSYNVDRTEVWNNRVRRVLHERRGGTAIQARVECGDKLILNGPWLEYDEEGNRVVKYPNFTELSVDRTELTTQTLPTPDGRASEWRCYQCKVRAVDVNTGVETEGEIRILHGDDRNDFATYLHNWKEYKAAVYNSGDKQLIADATRREADVRTHFANFGYNFALTVHRAQGSSFQYVLLDESNIRQMLHTGKELDYHPVMYVGVSRARYCLVMMGKGEG